MQYINTSHRTKFRPKRPSKDILLPRRPPFIPVTPRTRGPDRGVSSFSWRTIMPLSAQQKRERRAAQRAAEAQRVRSVPRTLVARILVARIGCATPLSTASRAGAAHMRHGEGGRDLLPVLRPSASGHGPRGTCAPREAPLLRSRPALTRLGSTPKHARL